MANCKDSDGDGIVDLLDIDDDNDGVLDATESPSCFMSISDWNTSEKSMYVNITSDLTTLAGYTNFGELTDNEGALSGTKFVTATAQGQLNKSIFKVEFSSPTQLDALYIQKYDATQIFGATAASLKLQGSNDNNSWTDLTDALSQPANASYTTVNGGKAITNSNKFIVTTGAGKYKYYRIYGILAANILSGTANEFYFDINNNSYQASNFPLATCTTDTDGDGILNNLDLDSDGDGCSDALESGATTNTTANLQFSFVSPTNDANSNGLIDIKEGATSGSINYNSSYDAYALTALINACLDSDQDGVNDVNDIDDDNDGILDNAESYFCSTTPNYTFKNINGTTTGALGYNAAFPAWMLNSFTESENGYRLIFDEPVSDIVLQFASIYQDDRIGDFTVKLKDGTIISGLDFNLLTSYGPTNSIWSPQPNNTGNFNGNFTKYYGTPFSTGTPYFRTTIANTGSTQSWGIVQLKNIAGAAEVGISELSFKINGGTATSGTGGLAVFASCFFDTDTDNDGIANRLDLDSDGVCCR